MSGDLILRDPIPDDVPAITAIYRHYVENTVITFELEPPDEAEMAARIDAMRQKGHPYFVGERGGRIIGYAYASTYRPRPAYRFACEDSIYLDPDETGKGTGTAMLAELIERSRKAGFHQMIGIITEGTTASVRLHEKFGFETLGVFPELGFKFDRWLGIIHMQKSL